ncbi:MAG TPA: hypothetical protein VKG23_01410 [Thermoanaerobaculia bacterium]|nr:hypothetical protein [Thermoanaerobaculia bacterium]
MRPRILGLCLAALVAAGCRKVSAPPAATAPRVPKGDVLWFVDPSAAADPTLDGALQRIGAAAVLIPGGTLGSAAGPKAFTAAPSPPRPVGQAAVVLVLSADDALAASLSGGPGPEAEGLAGAVTPAVSREVSSGEFGRVAGIHLDFPFTARSAARYAALVTKLRGGLPAGTFVSISIRSMPTSPDERKAVAPLFAAADALVAFVFGTGPRVDPIEVDAPGRPWWAAYDMRTVGQIEKSGEPGAAVPERLVEPLSGSPRFQFENDLTINDASVSAFTLTARAPVQQDGLSLAPGDRIVFRLPSVSEMLFQLGSNLAGKKHVLGRAVLFGGKNEGERVFEVAALEDVLLGRSLAPVLDVRVQPAGRNAVTVDLSNRAHHATVPSRVDNWVEVDLSPAHPADVQIGGFDRYEVYDGGGHAVTPGRAASVRLFETLIAPLETVNPARIVARGALPKVCCRYRVHAVSAAGPEVASDWIEPPPPPTPPPVPTKAAPAARRGRP